MSDGQIKVIRYEVEQIGKHIKGTKRRYLWVLSISQRVYNIVLDDSLLSGRSRLTINGRVFHEAEQGVGGCNYDHTFIVDECLFNISYVEGSYQMKVNKRSFSHLLSLQRNDSEFKEHKVEENSFQLTNNSRPIGQKKITLSLPGMGNGMKKKKPIVQSDNWSSFCQQGAFDPFAQKILPKQTNKSEAKQYQTQKPIETNVVKQTSDVTSSEFNTLQNLFKTMSTSKPFQQNIKQGQTPIYQLSQIPALPQINLKEFTTIQQLFATSCNQNSLISQIACGTSKIQDPFNKKQQIKSSDFNTMKALFQTINCPPQNTLVSNIKQSAQNVNPANFNTLRPLFATNILPKNLNQSIFKQSQKLNPSVAAFASSTINKSNFDDFTTIQCIFETNNGQKQNTNNLEGTILNSTNKTNLIQAELNVKQMGINKTLGEQQAKTTEKAVQKPKWDDFNTMQNLFKTGVQAKKQNQFWKFD